VRLSDKDVRHVARLSALEISDNEIDALRETLGDILEYVNTLSSVPTQGVEPTSHVHGVVNAFRDDIIKDSLSVEDVERNAPDFAGNSFRVPRII
jgi:aspartyl-tRNA(Asn)/glutamyl-tRNA(Gln) amidotransferase subunit C